MCGRKAAGDPNRPTKVEVRNGRPIRYIGESPSTELRCAMVKAGFLYLSLLVGPIRAGAGGCIL